MQTLIFIGISEYGANATNGEAVKNRLLIDKFKEIFSHVIVINLKSFKRRIVLIAITIVFVTLIHPKSKIIISASSKVANICIRFLKIFHIKGVYYWVVGGAFADYIKQGLFNVNDYKYLDCILVQSRQMVDSLHQCGLSQTTFIENAKSIPYMPIKEIKAYDKVRFVFLSRISVTKGCNYIFEAVQRLNEEGFQSKYSVTFYGKVDDSYDNFEFNIHSYENTHYGGFLNLLANGGYDQLAQYDVLLFPTYWEGEGFAGIFIDSFIAGLPIICSDWNCNKEIVSSDTGIIIPTHDADALRRAMLDVICGKYEITNMSQKCQIHAMDYDINNVLSDSKLHKLNLL